MVQLEHVHVTDRHRALELLTGATILQHDLTTFRQTSQLQHALDLLFTCTVEYGGCKRHALLQIGSQLNDLDIGKGGDIFLLAGAVVDLVDELAYFLDLSVRFEHGTNFQAQALGSPTQMRFKNLAHVHARRYAQRVQHDVHRRTVRHEWHVFHRNDLGDHTLVAVTTGHLVARLQAPFHGHVDLDHLLYAGRQFITAGKFFLFLFEHAIEFDALLRQAVLELFKLTRGIFVRQANVEPVVALHLVQILLADLGTLGQFGRAAVGGFTRQQALDPSEGVLLDDTHLVVQIIAETLQFIVNDLLGALVAFDPLTGEYLYVNHRARHAGR